MRTKSNLPRGILGTDHLWSEDMLSPTPTLKWGRRALGLGWQGEQSSLWAQGLYTSRKTRLSSCMGSRLFPSSSVVLRLHWSSVCVVFQVVSRSGSSQKLKTQASSQLLPISGPPVSCRRLDWIKTALVFCYGHPLILFRDSFLYECFPSSV